MRNEFSTEDSDAILQPNNYGIFVRVTLKELGLKPVYLCDHFGMSVPTVVRHINGESLPVKPARKMIVGHLANLLTMPQDYIDNLDEVYHE